MTLFFPFHRKRKLSEFLERPWRADEQDRAAKQEAFFMVMSGLPYCTVVKPTFVEFLRQLRPGFAPLTVRQLHDEIDKIHLEVDAGVCSVSLKNVFFS